MHDDRPLWRPAPGADTDPVADDLFLVELELDARHPGQRLAVFGHRHYGMRPGELAFVSVEISGPFDQRSPEASARRKTLRREARALLERLGYRIALTPGRNVHHIDPCRENLSTHDRLERLRSFRERLDASAADDGAAMKPAPPQPAGRERMHGRTHPRD